MQRSARSEERFNSKRNTADELLIIYVGILPVNVAV